MTASGGNLIGSEVNRNERSVQWTVATIEVAGYLESRRFLTIDETNVEVRA